MAVYRDVLPALWRSHAGRCRFCGRRTFMYRDARHVPGMVTRSGKLDGDSGYLPATVEHLTPVADGGDNEPGNLTLACLPCNLRRGKEACRRRNAAGEALAALRRARLRTLAVVRAYRGRQAAELAVTDGEG